MDGIETQRLGERSIRRDRQFICGRVGGLPGRMRLHGPGERRHIEQDERQPGHGEREVTDQVTTLAGGDGREAMNVHNLLLG